ncbi:hypothetical protein KKC59_03495 [bacterium]|nr:hypothetical protein [bacterium]
MQDDDTQRTRLQRKLYEIISSHIAQCLFQPYDDRFYEALINEFGLLCFDNFLALLQGGCSAGVSDSVIAGLLDLIDREEVKSLIKTCSKHVLNDLMQDLVVLYYERPNLQEYIKKVLISYLKEDALIGAIDKESIFPKIPEGRQPIFSEEEEDEYRAWCGSGILDNMDKEAIKSQEEEAFKQECKRLERYKGFIDSKLEHFYSDKTGLDKKEMSSLFRIYMFDICFEVNVIKWGFIKRDVLSLLHRIVFKIPNTKIINDFYEEFKKIEINSQIAVICDLASIASSDLEKTSLEQFFLKLFFDERNTDVQAEIADEGHDKILSMTINNIDFIINNNSLTEGMLNYFYLKGFDKTNNLDAVAEILWRVFVKNPEVAAAFYKDKIWDYYEMARCFLKYIGPCSIKEEKEIIEEIQSYGSKNERCAWLCQKVKTGLYYDTYTSAEYGYFSCLRISFFRNDYFYLKFRTNRDFSLDLRNSDIGYIVAPDNGFWDARLFLDVKSPCLYFSICEDGAGKEEEFAIDIRDYRKDLQELIDMLDLGDYKLEVYFKEKGGI